MAQQRAKKRSRKAGSARRTAAPVPKPAAVAEPAARARTAKPAAQARVAPKVSPRAQPKTRREQREEREALALARSRYSSRALGKYGPQPKSIFHPVPVAEIAILAGLVGVVIGFIERGSPALPVGAVVCALAVFEFTARDHFSGYRSHTTLLAAFPAALVEVVLAVTVGIPAKDRILLLAPVIPVFALAFWLLRKVFQNARHQRVLKYPAR